jgi:hypothetical protein
MDTIALVDGQIDDGEKLLDQLRREHLPVKAACWVKPVEEDRWSLYIATPLVEEKGAAGAYREVYRVLRSLGNIWVADSDVKLIGDRHPITAEVLEILQRHPGKMPLRSRRASLGGLPIEEVYIYQLDFGREMARAEQRRLKKDVEQIARPEEVLLTEQEKMVRSQIVSSGVSLEDAEKWVRMKRPQSPPRPPIPKGTLVSAWVTAYWGSKPEDDTNPLLLVQAQDGARGLVLKSDTELA